MQRRLKGWIQTATQAVRGVFEIPGHIADARVWLEWSGNLANMSPWLLVPLIMTGSLFVIGAGLRFYNFVFQSKQRVPGLSRYLELMQEALDLIEADPWRRLTILGQPPLPSTFSADEMATETRRHRHLESKLEYL